MSIVFNNKNADNRFLYYLLVRILGILGWLVLFAGVGRTLNCLLNVATFGAEISDSGKLLPTLTTLFEKKWPANFVLVLLTKKIFEYPLSSLWRRE